ncbi:hypothetical protein QFC21_004807 [Naganishia friedmannii]|uniref:Uncharacterized protein n=1 Tax=Naganishia friedmannii TaxID=89922 RepID=A0ACC2VDD9_9TREE|nr:hypothetical protein QFC21_004807 [Naganishia friedmannii]
MLTDHSRLLNILFLGSDHFSIGTLQALLAATSPRLWESIHVVTAGEKDVGRGKNGKRKVAPPLHNYALERGLEVSTIPERGIQDWQPPDPYTSPSPRNILITSSFGHILPSQLLLDHFPSPETRLNVHPSILPQYRGAAPIQWAIANRDARTGISVQSLARGGGKMVDRGDLWGVVEGVATSAPQNTPASITSSTQAYPTTLPKARRAPKITHETVHVDFARQTDEEVEALFRGMSHQHALWTTLPDGQELRLLDIRIPASDTDLPSSLQPGATIFQKSFPAEHTDTSSTDINSPGSASGGRLWIRTRSREDDQGDAQRGGWIEVRRVQQAGKKELSVRDWWNGLKVPKGEVLILGASSGR